MSWFLLAIIAAAPAYLVYEHRTTFMKGPAMSDAVHSWLVRLLWIGLCLTALGFVLRGVGELLATPAAAADRPQTAYTTDHPGKNPPWFGLVASDGRYEVLLGIDSGCDTIGADMNVLLERSDATNEATWTLQLPDSDQVCSVAEWHWMGNEPCEQNADGVCDVAGEQD